MSGTILETKLHAPMHSDQLVDRPDLIDTFNKAISKRLVLISAPAGYGKSTLVLQWSRQSKMAIAWFVIDDGDNNAMRFITYLIKSIQSHFP